MPDPSIQQSSAQLHLPHPPPHDHSFAADASEKGHSDILVGSSDSDERVKKAVISAVFGVADAASGKERGNAEVAADNGDAGVARAEERGKSAVATDIVDAGVTVAEERLKADIAADSCDICVAEADKRVKVDIAADNGDVGAAEAEECVNVDIAAKDGDVDVAEVDERVKEADIAAGDVDAAEVDERVKEADIADVDAAEAEERVKEADIVAKKCDADVAEVDERMNDADIADVDAAEAEQSVKEADIITVDGNVDAAEVEESGKTYIIDADNGDSDAVKAKAEVKSEFTAENGGGDTAVVEEENAEVAAVAVGYADIADTDVREDTENLEVLADNGNAHSVVAEERVEEERTMFSAKISKVDVMESKEEGNADVAAGGGGEGEGEVEVDGEEVEAASYHITHRQLAEGEECRDEEGASETQGAGVEEREEIASEERERKKCFVRFPVRRNAEDCGFYMRTGMCKFGMNCKFNHPPEHLKNSPLGGKVKGREESTDAGIEKKMEREDSMDRGPRVDCKYFDRPGGCKFGKACKFYHSRKVGPTLELNFMGLPIRPGEKECPYYMRNGSCKFGASCRFNHPDPTSVGGPDALPSHRTRVESISSPDASQSTLAPWSPLARLNESPAYAPMVFLSTHCAPPQSEWNGYQAPLYPPESCLKVGPTYAMNSRSSERNNYAHRQDQILVDEFPERPGQPECAYFLRTGSCKYRSACKYHHPKKSTGNSISYSLSDLGLPLRPGVSICSYYSRYGICKYGPACKYDHPVNYTLPVTGSSVDLTHGLSNGMVNNHAMAASS